MPTSPEVPLVLDVDGTLVLTDTLLESFLQLVKRSPRALLMAPFWILGGRAAFKHRVAERTDLDAARLPYNAELLRFVEEERGKGRKIVLATGANHRTAKKIADHLGISEVLASDRTRNLTGKVKLKLLLERYGEKNFDYAGNGRIDLAIWPHARNAIVANASASTLAQAGKAAHVTRVFPSPPVGIRACLRALRVRHWTKNLLVFVPLAAAHKLGQPELWERSIVAFLSFCALTSSVYLLNDLLRLESDRPTAAGHLPPLAALMTAPLLLAASALACVLLPLEFSLAAALYFALAMAYSLFKRAPLLDTFTVAGVYTLRVTAGGAATGIPISRWLMAFSMLFFLSLGFLTVVDTK